MLEQLKQRLADAEQAEHELLTGESVRVVVDQNGERIEYNAANASRLRTYIAELQRRIAVCQNQPQTNRPMRVFF